jgi:beta-glucosidase
MKVNFSIVILLLVSSILISCKDKQRLAFESVESKVHSAVIPVQQTEEWTLEWWMPRHHAVNERLKKGNVDLLFIGNSITHEWESEGKVLWEKYYEHRNAVNMGFGGDKTQHVLWRLEHSDFSSISPKLAVVMIGTNNSNGNDNTAEEIADGIIKICKKLRSELTETKILLMAIFPRDSLPTAQRLKNETASKLASEIADGKMIHYIDINNRFLTDEGRLSKDIMPDYLHPNENGYKIWAEAIEYRIQQLMDEEK